MNTTTASTTTTMNANSFAAALYRKFCKQLNSDYQKTMHLPEPDMFALMAQSSKESHEARVKVLVKIAAKKR